MATQAAQPEPSRIDDRPLHGKLRWAWASKQLCHLAHGAGHLLAWPAGVALVVLPLDWLIDLPGPVRSVLLAGLCALGLWQAYVRGWRRLCRYHPRRVGLDVERQYPDLNSLLVSYVDFTDAPPQPGTSQQLKDHVRQQAVETSRPLNFGRIAPVRHLRPGLAAVAVVLAAYVALSVWQPQLMWAFARRMVTPLSTASYPTNTTVVMVTRDVLVPEGGELTLAARSEGVRPDTGVLRVRGEGRDWEELEVRPDADGRFEYHFREVYQGFEYAFELGDDRSDRYEVRVVSAPRVVDATVRVTPPDYTNTEPEDRLSLTLNVPEQSTIRWTLTLDKPVADPQVLLEAGTPTRIAMTCSADGRTVTAEAAARASCAYRFLWADRRHKDFHYEGPKHYLQVLVDHGPAVRIAYPAQNEKATLAKTLTVTYDARDDYGIHAATLIYHRNDGAAVREPLDLDGDQSNTHLSRTFERKLTDLIDGLKEGDTVRYHIEVCDAYPASSGPHRALSKPRRVQILSSKEYLAHIQRRRRELIGQLRPVYRQERVASEKVRGMTASAGHAAAPARPGEPSDD